MAMPAREHIGSQTHRYGFNGMEFDSEVKPGDKNSYHTEFRQYDPRVGRWTSEDPEGLSRPSWSPYNSMRNSPIVNVDPFGDKDNWYQNEDGDIKWFNSTGEGFSDAEGNSWTDIGSELLEFNGAILKYSWESGNAVDGLTVNEEKFVGVSGAPLSDGGIMDYPGGMLSYEEAQTFAFSFSTERQKIPNVGPIVEGLYSINKDPFKAESNESGYQRFHDMNLFKQAAAEVGRTNWPGGTNSWGDYRWKLEFEDVDTERSNFYLHGGSKWGSRGCLDLGCGINKFYNSFMSRDLGNSKIYLKVSYPDNFKYEIKNTYTNRFEPVKN